MRTWHPEEKPYRCVFTEATGAYGCNGWRHGRTETFATEAEAVEMATSKFAGQVIEATVSRTRVDAAGNLVGWMTLGTRKRGKEYRAKGGGR